MITIEPKSVNGHWWHFTSAVPKDEAGIEYDRDRLVTKSYPIP